MKPHLELKLACHRALMCGPWPGLRHVSLEARGEQLHLAVHLRAPATELERKYIGNVARERIPSHPELAQENVSIIHTNEPTSLLDLLEFKIYSEEDPLVYPLIDLQLDNAPTKYDFLNDYVALVSRTFPELLKTAITRAKNLERLTDSGNPAGFHYGTLRAYISLVIHHYKAEGQSFPCIQAAIRDHLATIPTTSPLDTSALREKILHIIATTEEPP